MKLLITLTLVVTSYTCFSQKYEYLSMYQVRAGMADKAKIDFSWPDKPDSAKHLTNLKLRDPLTAIQTMESKGFELVSIHEYGPGNLVVITDVYMRRKKK